MKDESKGNDSSHELPMPLYVLAFCSKLPDVCASVAFLKSVGYRPEDWVPVAVVLYVGRGVLKLGFIGLLAVTFFLASRIPRLRDFIYPWDDARLSCTELERIQKLRRRGAAAGNLPRHAILWTLAVLSLPFVLPFVNLDPRAVRWEVLILVATSLGLSVVLTAFVTSAVLLVINIRKENQSWFRLFLRHVLKLNDLV